jgi:hypothetical protein
VSDWTAYDGENRPEDDVWVEVEASYDFDANTGPAGAFDWDDVERFRIINQHLIEKEGSIAAQNGYLQGLRSAKLAALAETKEYVSGYIRYQQFIDVIKGYEREVRRAMNKK